VDNAGLTQESVRIEAGRALAANGQRDVGVKGASARHLYLCSTGGRVWALTSKTKSDMADADARLFHVVGAFQGVEGVGSGEAADGAWSRNEQVARVVNKIEDRVLGRICEAWLDDAVAALGVELD
jgi:hypothetical protein